MENLNIKAKVAIAVKGFGGVVYEVIESNHLFNGDLVDMGGWVDDMFADCDGKSTIPSKPGLYLFEGKTDRPFGGEDWYHVGKFTLIEGEPKLPKEMESATPIN